MIIAVDFDGILCENNFPNIGAPKYKIISLIRQLLDKGHEVILWTSRVGDELEAAIDWCGDYGLHFTEVNENAPSNRKEYEQKYPQGTRKVYADIYLDDHNIEYMFNNKNRFGNKNFADDLLVNYLERGLKEWKVKEEK